MGFATFLSRLLGVIRVRLESTVLGGGEIASGWFFAFAIPNLLRRVLGEGAVSSALIPLIAETQAEHGEEKVQRQLGIVFLFLSAVLAVLVIVFSLIAVLITKYAASWNIELLKQPYLQLAFKLLPLLMPYAFFICLTGVATAVLNYSSVFIRPALAALLLNIGLLGGLSAAWIFAMPDFRFLPMLACIVPVAGAVQLLLMVIWLYKCRMLPEFRGCFQESGIVKKLLKLALPGILGYSALQVSFVIDRMMAASLGKQAIPALTYIDRIVDIPIGVIAVSIGNVLMPMMSRAAAAGKREEVAETLAYSLRIMWFMTLPLAFMVIFFHNNMLHLLCLGGRYTLSDLNAAHLVAIFYGVGIPFFCSLKAIYPAFYARKKMMVVLKVSLCAIIINLAFNYVLMQFLAQGGIALATVISSLFNNGVLLWLLKRENMTGNSRQVVWSLLRNSMAALLVGAGLYWIYSCYLEAWAFSHWSCEIYLLAGLGIVYAMLYLLAGKIFGATEFSEIIKLLRKR